MDTVIVALRVVLSLAVVFGLLWLMHRRVTRGARANGRVNLVTVVGRQGLGQKASVVVVDVDGQRLVLGVTEQSVTVLHGTLTPVEAPAAAFAESLTQATLTDAAHADDSAEPLERPLAFRPRRKAVPSTRLAGSILSPTTWQQTAAALKQGR